MFLIKINRNSLFLLTFSAFKNFQVITTQSDNIGTPLGDGKFKLF